MRYDITPMPKPRMVRSDKWKKRPVVEKYWAYKDEIKSLGIEIEERSKIIFWIPMPESWPNKKKCKEYGQPHRQKPDIDNLYKALLDCLYEDDSHVWCADIEKRWCYNGGIEVR